MGSFYTVSTGAVGAAADLNQYAGILNGTTAGAVSLLATASTATPLFTYLPTAPAADQNVVQSSVTADTQPRVSSYVRGADGYGGLVAGAGSTPTAHWYAQSNGWKTGESVTIGGALTTQGNTTLAGIVSTGNLSLDSGYITSDGSGNVTAVSFKGKIGTIRNGTAQVNTVFTGTSTPSSPAVGDIWIQA